MPKRRYQLVIVVEAPKGRTPAEIGHAALQVLDDTEGLSVVSLAARVIKDGAVGPTEWIKRSKI